MRKKANQGLGSISLWKASALGTVLSLCTCLLATVLIAFLVNKEVIKKDALDWMTNIIWLVSIIIGTLAAQRKSTNTKLAAVAMTVLCFAMIVSLITMIAFDGEFHTIGKGILMILCGTIPSLITILKKPKKNKVRFKI